MNVVDPFAETKAVVDPFEGREVVDPFASVDPVDSAPSEIEPKIAAWGAGDSSWSYMADEGSLPADVLEAFGRRTAAAGSSMPIMMSEISKLRDKAVSEVGEKLGFEGRWKDAFEAAVPRTPLDLAGKTYEKTLDAFPEAEEALKQFGKSQIEKAEGIQSEYMSGKPLGQAFKEGDWDAVGNDIGTAIAFETPNLALQLALGYFSGGGSLAYMGVSAAGAKRAGMTDEDSLEKRVLNPIATGAVETATEKFLGTGRIIDRMGADKVKKAIGKRLLDIFKDASGGAVSEGGATFGENVIDRISGEDVDLRDGVLLSTIVGSIMDANAGIATSGIGHDAGVDPNAPVHVDAPPAMGPNGETDLALYEQLNNLLAREAGKSGWAMGRGAEESLYNAYRNNKIAEQKAVAIAQAVPNNEVLQRVGLDYAQQNESASADDVRHYMNAIRSMVGRGTVEELDLFGNNDAALNEARQLAKTAMKLQRRLSDERRVLKNARKVSKVSGKNAEVLKQYGIEAGDVDAMNQRIEALDADIDNWNRWPTNPDLVDQLRTDAGLPTVERKALSPEQEKQTAETPQGAPAKTEAEAVQGDIFKDQYAADADLVAAFLRARGRDVLDRGDVDRSMIGQYLDGAREWAKTTGKYNEEHRGTSKVPETDAGPSSTVPDWVLKSAETKQGRKLVQAVGKGDGRKVSLRTVVDFVNTAVRVQMRRSTVQTSRKHPAHYRPTGHVAFTRNTQSQINFHEAGHGLKELLDARSPGFFERYGESLIMITKLPGSYASAENVHEGVAEWVRLRIMNPQAVQDLRVTAAIESEITRALPEVGMALRDASRAMHSFANRPAAERWSMVANAPKRLTASDVKDWAVGMGGQFSDLLSSGAPVSRLDREMFKAIVKDRESAKLSRDAALKRARKVRRNVTEPVLAAHNMVLQIGQEVQKAISGTGKDRGLRIIMDETDGNYVWFMRRTWKDIVDSVPAGKWKQFQEAGWAKEALSRWLQDGLEYPGQMDGIKPADLQNIVNQAERDIPNFAAHVQSVQLFFDSVLDLKDFGGLKADGEVQKMRRRGDYWPLPRVVENVPNAVSSGGNISAGDYRAKGSGEAIKGLSETAEERVRDAMTAYYMNRLGLKMADSLRETANDASLPWLAREIAGRQLQPLKLGQAIAATVSRDEALDWIVPALNQQKMEVLGRELTEEEMIRNEDINLSWNFKDVWRPTAPKDFNVVSFLRDGERKFYQIDDPAMFRMFAQSDQAKVVTSAVMWMFNPTMQNWKRNVTQSLPFSVNNLNGDLINQVMLNKDAVGWFPGGATVLGAVNRFTKKYPQVMQEGLLLSRVEPGSVELVNRVKHNAVWQFMSEGFYVSQAKNPAAKFALTALQPSNWLYPVWKVGDLVNLITGGRYVAPRLEGATREGAGVAAKMEGRSDEEANYAYWRATGTFNEHSGVSDLAQLFRMPGFFNPYVQAVRGAGKVLTDPDPAVSGASWAKLLVQVPAMFGTAAFLAYLFMDDDERKRERERTVDDRMSYHQLNGFKLRFPYGPEGAMASLIYNGVMDQLLGLPQSDAHRKARLALNRMAGMGSPMEFMGPQLKALTEAQMNYSSFRQKHIVSPWMNGLPEDQQYKMSTPEFYKKLGKWADYSPDKLQYIVQNALNRQTDEVIRMLDRMDQGKALDERADLPFVGRLFVRDPNGFNSRSGQELSAIEDKLLGLDNRLNSSGYAGLKDGSLTPATQTGAALEVQLLQLEGLRLALSDMRRYSRDVKAYEIAENPEQADNLRRAMLLYAQSVLTANPESAEQIKTALDLVDQMPSMAPEAKAAEYLRR